MIAVAVAVWAGPLQLDVSWHQPHLSDLPTYENAARQISDGHVPYKDFDLEYPPLAAALFWLVRIVPGPYAVVFSIAMLLALVATALGVMATARALGLDRRREAVAGLGVALVPLLLGNLVQTRFDLALTALVSWLLYAAVSSRFRLAWALLGAATLLKLVPVVLAPVLAIFHGHRRGGRRVAAGAATALAIVVSGLGPFVALSASGIWRLAAYHIDRPLQIESLASSYLLGLHAIADVSLRVVTSFGSQNLAGSGPATVAAISTALLVVVVIAVAVTLAVLLRRTRPPADARLFLAAAAATTIALLAGGKVFSPQFIVWLVPVGFVVSGRYGWATAAGTLAVMLLTQVYFPRDYWSLVNLESGPIGLLVLRNAAIVALLALAWPRPLAPSPGGEVLPRWLRPASSEAGDSAVAARYLTD